MRILSRARLALTFAIKRANTAGKITHPLEVFRTPDNRGWGVRAAKRIPAGEFVSLTTFLCSTFHVLSNCNPDVCLDRWRIMLVS